MATIFVSKYGIKHFKRSKIHAMNTLETHLRHFEQAFWYLPKISKVAFYKTPSGGHLDLSIWPKINRLPPLSDLKDCAKFENNHTKQSGLRVSAS